MDDAVTVICYERATVSEPAAPLVPDFVYTLQGLPEGRPWRYHQLEHDDATRTFVKRALTRRHGALKTAAHRWLARRFSDFDINAWLDMYPLFLLSGDSFEALLRASGFAPHGRLLDVGAGSGDVTQHIAPWFAEVHTTETSAGMAKRLGKRGFTCKSLDLGANGAVVGGAPFDVITVFNVVDRAPRPLSLLRNLGGALGPGGRLVLATPLPFRPFYYQGPHTEEPLEALDFPGGAWSEEALHLLETVLPQAGLEPLVVSRCPYLSGGDSRQPLYVLDDIVCVCGVSQPPA